MSHALAQLRQRRGLALASAVIATLAALLPGYAIATGPGPVPPPPTSPTSVDQIQNIDQVRTAIKGYYGDTLTGAVDPVPNSIDGADVRLHTFDPNGAYAAEVAELQADAGKYLDRTVKVGHTDGQPALIFDIDDTTLNTYNYEIYSNFAYNPVTNGYFVNSASFPAVPGMPGFVTAAAAKGYEVFFLTGRPEAQRAGTLTNLVSAGFPAPAADHLFLKNQTLPWVSSCAPTCSSAQYKALTRRHLVEDLGMDIVANFGDQPSDFTGGYADTTYRLPNPMYYLP